jgi:Family of unknown function (DUF6941)
MPEITSLLLCNHADQRDGLLFVNGGGWNHLSRPLIDGRPPMTHFSIAVAAQIEWTESNVVYDSAVSLEDEDGRELLAMRGRFSLTPHRNQPPGSTLQGTICATIDFTFPHPGTYRAVACVGEARRTVAFSVSDR